MSEKERREFFERAEEAKAKRVAKEAELQKRMAESLARTAERKHMAWDRLASFLFDLAKLSFAGVVIGTGISYVNDTANMLLFWVFVFGVYLTFGLAYLAYSIIKYND